MQSTEATRQNGADIDALIEETRAFLAQRPLGPAIYGRLGKVLAALEAVHASAAREKEVA